MAHSPICSVDGCGNKHCGRGYCAVHYQRWYRHGDPLLGKTQTTKRGEPQRFFRSTVLTHDGDECLLWPFSRHDFGYGQFQWEGRVRHVHAVLCAIVHGPKPSPRHEVAHSCGRGHEGCVNKHHLRWDTRLGNQADRKGHGTHMAGERHGMARLTEQQVREIRAIRGTETVVQTAARYGVSMQHISGIQTRKYWGSLD